MKLENIPVALTFNDVLLVPSYSRVIPNQVDTSSRLTKDITLKAPILSASMDTVTEAATAICMAQHGGMGVIHKNFDIESQALEVKKVKKHESGMVIDPLTVPPDITINEALAITKKHGYSGLPVVENKKLVGILTKRDVRFLRDMSKKVGDVMTKNLITAKEDVSIDEAKSVTPKK